jgi:hypothetical protein
MKVLIYEITLEAQERILLKDEDQEPSHLITASSVSAENIYGI